jgi:adenosylcobinamide kinase/adenosylcobinamide-phosphate guanylyltransferase
MTLIGGGARSGKSSYALELARMKGKKRLFVATAQAFDAEMQRRITAHKVERGEEFVTLEEPHAVESAFQNALAFDVVVLDCLTLWLSNLLLADIEERTILQRVEALGSILAERRVHSIIITNEVGMGIVPETALGRTFRDLSGRAHQRLSAMADELYLGAIGVMLRLRPAPVQVVPRQDA